MTSRARKKVETSSGITTYDTLEALLVGRYKDKATVLQAHERLMAKKKTHKEDYLDYMYDMMKICNSKMDELSIIKLIVDGLQEDSSYKQTLYQAKTKDELEDKLEIFGETMKEKTTAKKATEDHKHKGKSSIHFKGKSDSQPKKTNCFNCGEPDHKSDDCPSKEKHCDSFGHISKDCRQPKKAKDQRPNTKTHKEPAMTTMCAVPQSTNTMTLPRLRLAKQKNKHFSTREALIQR